MGLAVFSFLAVFLLISSIGLLVFLRTGMAQRLSTVIAPRSETQSVLERFKFSRAASSLKSVVLPFDKLIPKSTQEVSVTQKRLIRAGYRDDSDVRMLFGSKVLVPALLCLLVTVTRVSEYGPFFVYALALGLGYLLPDFWLGRRIAARQLNIRVGLPDFLDLLVVCIEAGLSLDQALARATEELGLSQPDVCDEFGLVMLEQRAGRLRVDAWKELADRVDIDILRTLVTSIIQAEQFGTSIAKTLRTYSESLRVQRRQKVEEMAAKMAVKLVFPLVLFIFPSLFVVTLGPPMMVIIESFDKYFK